MMLASQRFTGLAKAMIGGVLPLAGTSWHKDTVVGRDQQVLKNSVIPAPIDTHPMSATASRGLAIRRPLATKAAAERFVHEMQSRELTAERTWRALWEFYLWLCGEEELIPLPETMQARFAQELNKLCRRGQVRVRAGGKLRRLTTYTIPDVDAIYLQVAA